VGGWIEFEISRDATVRRIEITCGYSRIKGRDDFFLQNHRISRVEVLREGKSLGVFPLDVNQRGLQALPVAGQGGVYRIVVKATIPGTRKAWRELAVSELKVMGDPGKERRSPNERLEVTVGSLDNPSPHQLRETGMGVRDYDAITKAAASPDQFCAEFLQTARANAAQLLKDNSDRGVEHLGKPYCYTLLEEHAVPNNPTYARVVPIPQSTSRAGRARVRLGARVLERERSLRSGLPFDLSHGTHRTPESREWLPCHYGNGQQILGSY
jgi:hypothetical protein